MALEFIKPVLLYAGSPSDSRSRFNIPAFDLGAAEFTPRILYVEEGEKQAQCNYGRTHFSWLPVIENMLQIGWWHGISNINNVSSDWVTDSLICWEKVTHTYLPDKRKWDVRRTGRKTWEERKERRQSVRHVAADCVWPVIDTLKNFI